MISSQEIREKLNSIYAQFRPTMELYRQYAESVAALSVEFHKSRLLEAYPGAVVEELALAVSLDLRQSPASLEKALVELGKAPVKTIIFDPVRFQAHLFV